MSVAIYIKQLFYLLVGVGHIGLFFRICQTKFFWIPINLSRQEMEKKIWKKSLKKCGSHFYRLVVSLKGVEIGHFLDLNTEKDLKDQ